MFLHKIVNGSTGNGGTAIRQCSVVVWELDLQLKGCRSDFKVGHCFCKCT
uniref:Uncharacterized protein n=1 Tax=Anguilla anguilla TaxID=7936 RepID=A0A0E9SVM9_ANGAN